MCGHAWSNYSVIKQNYSFKVLFEKTFKNFVFQRNQCKQQIDTVMLDSNNGITFFSSIHY